jgi:hypothetical protein
MALHLVVAHLWLCPQEAHRLSRAFLFMRLGSPFGLYDIQPLVPIAIRRYKGFGNQSTQRSASHELPSHELVCHYRQYLDPATRFSIVRACPMMGPYVRLLKYAGTHRHAIRCNLKHARASPHSETGLNRYQTRDGGPPCFCSTATMDTL